jgi:hypothetical protein
MHLNNFEPMLNPALRGNAVIEQEMTVWEPILVPATATTLAGKSAAHTHATRAIAVSAAHTHAARAIAEPASIPSAGIEIRVFLLHFDALLNPFLVQLTFKLGDLLLQSNGFIDIRVLFGHFAS